MFGFLKYYFPLPVRACCQCSSAFQHRGIICARLTVWSGPLLPSRLRSVLVSRWASALSYPRLTSLAASSCCTDAQRALQLLEQYRAKLNHTEDRQLRHSIQRVIDIFQSNLFQALIGTVASLTTEHLTHGYHTSWKQDVSSPGT